VFRLLPFATKTGLRVIGQPGPDAPVFVTCNFDLTVRRVLKSLQGLDCYLLVAPSKGINVWCAASGGMFNAHSVVSVIKTSRIADKVHHRTLVLPQLSAPGIDVVRVERETGWQCRFGPVYAQDIPAYVEANQKKTDSMRRVRFPLGDRLEMAVMWAGMLSVVAGIPVALFRLRALPGLLAMVWGFSLFLLVFFDEVDRYVPGPVALVKTMVLGLVGVGGVLAYGLGIAGWGIGRALGWSLAILGVAFVLGFDLDGTSPLRAGSTAAYWSVKWPRILDLWALIGYEIEERFCLEVDVERCKGCSTCVEVCPKGVFELYRLNGRLKSQVARPAECELCTACVKQCPERAILADPPIAVFEQVRV
jgi:NAD-dependent dihydropyrimidine dehydrogenase PreA subunit